MADNWNEENTNARQRLNALLDRLPDAAFEKRIDQWPVPAVLAHLAFWDRRGAQILREWDAGNQALRRDDDWYDSHVLNHALEPEWFALHGPQAVRLAREAAEEVDSVIRALRQETIAAIAAQGEEWRFRRYNHRNEHVTAIEAAL